MLLLFKNNLITYLNIKERGSAPKASIEEA